MVAAAKEGWGDPGLWDDAEEIETDFHRFDKPGSVLVGKLVDKSEREIRGSIVGHYTFQREDGSNVSCHGSMQLDDKLAAIEPGYIVRIEYTHDETTANGQMKMFSVKAKATADVGS